MPSPSLSASSKACYCFLSRPKFAMCLSCCFDKSPIMIISVESKPNLISITIIIKKEPRTYYYLVSSENLTAED